MSAPRDKADVIGGKADIRREGPLLRAERTLPSGARMSAFSQYRTYDAAQC